MRLSCLFILIAFYTLSAHAQQPVPSIQEKDGRHTLMVDGKPFLILGGQAHNSSAWPAMLPKVWQAIETMHANTLEIPLYWEQIEPSRGKFDFSLMDTLLKQARTHKVRLVLLWFATWKNGSNHYMPEWMKKEPEKYPNIAGPDGQPIDSPAPDANATLDADTKAFASVMRHLKQADAQRTVIMVQVENEPGSWNSVRDFSPNAQKAFEGPVPAQLLQPSILTALRAPVVTSGSWKEVFGDRADEYFQAWSIGRFIGQVAAAGKAEYPLPMYVNAALRDPLTDPPATHYESGGPTDNVLPIWKTAAPAIDILCPDIYLSGTARVFKVLDLYSGPGNPLFIPEAGLIPENAKYLYAALGHGAIGFSPFGIDDNSLSPGASDASDKPEGSLHKLAPYGDAYAALAPMMRDLAQWIFDDKVRAVVEPEDHTEQRLDLGKWQAAVTFGKGRGYPLQGNTPPTGKLMIIRLDSNKFLLTGTGCRVTFNPLGSNAGKSWQYLKVEEGTYVNGRFHPGRILNGDETDWGGPLFGDKPSILQVTLQERTLPANTAVVPVPKLENDFYNWWARHAEVLHIKDSIDPEIILIGNSITHLWGGLPRARNNDGALRPANGPVTWDSLFGRHRVLNLGFGWDRTQNALWRLDHGEMDGLHPRLVIINIGTNNTSETPHARMNTASEIVEGVAAVCKRVQEKAPAATIVLMAIFPREQSPDHPRRQLIAATNKLLEAFAKKERLIFVDTWKEWLAPDGTLLPGITYDMTHPTEKGYRIWADAVRAYVK